MDGIDDITTLRAALAEREAELAAARAELTGAHLLIAQYKAQLHKLRRMRFGRSSEALDAQIEQLELKYDIHGHHIPGGEHRIGMGGVIHEGARHALRAVAGGRQLESSMGRPASCKAAR